MLLRFATRHFVRHWRMNVLLLLGLLLTAALLAALPLYATAIAGLSLRQRLDDAPIPARNLEVVGPNDSLTSALYGTINEALGDLVSDRVEVRDLSNLNGGRFVVEEDGNLRNVPERIFLRFWSFDTLASHVEVIEGHLPNVEPIEATLSHTTLEVVVGPGAAEGMNLSLGDEVHTQDGRFHLQVVGIVSPLEPTADMWWSDLLPFDHERVPACPSCPDDIFLSLLVHPQAMANFLPNHDRFWRILTNRAAVNVDNVGEIQGRIDGLESALADAQVRTGLVDILNAHQAQLATARVSLFLLTIQSLLFALYTVGMISAFLVDRSRGELVALSGRGFTGWQITQVYALEGFILAFLVAAPLSPIVARMALSVWGGLTDTPIPAATPAESWTLALVAVTFGWLALVVPVFLAARGDLLAYQRAIARPPARAAWQKVGLDLFLIFLGGLVYWQLRETGTFATVLNQGAEERAAGFADPLLLLGPSLLLIAVALVFLRLFPYLLRLAAWWGRQNSSFVLPFGLAKLSRDPVGPSRVVLLVSLAAGLTFFATTFSHSVQTRQAEMAHYLTGADLRVSIPIAAGETEYERLAGLPGVLAASPAYTNNRTRWASQLSRQATILAVDPDTFGAVARYAPAVSTLTMEGLLPALNGGSGEAIPAVFSVDAHPPDKQVGDLVSYMLGSTRLTFEVRGIIRNFPYLSGAYYITNLADLEAQAQLPIDGRKEMWLSLDPTQQTAVASQIENNGWGQVTGDTQAEIRSLQADLPAAETLGAFDLNAFVLAILSVAVFVLVHYFAARQRLFEFSLLRAIGLSTNELLALLSLEGVIMMVLGLVGGTVIGYGLAALMRPFFSNALATAVAGGSIYQLFINWPGLITLYGILLGAYLVVMLFSLAALLRAGVHRALRIGEE
jgi:ABC-type lipoprotein release transport system permease subunit